MFAKLKGFVPLRRLGAFLSALSLCFVLTLPCFASDSSDPSFSASSAWGWAALDKANGSVLAGASASPSVSAPFYGSTAVFSSASTTVPANASFFHLSFNNFHVVSNEWFSGAVGLYVSFFWRARLTGSGDLNFTWNSRSASSLSSLYEMYFINDIGAEETGSVDISFFTPVNSGICSQGVSFKASVVAQSYAPISQIGFRRITGVTFSGSGYADKFEMFVPSCTIVTTSTSGELAALENMADQISAQSQILSQFYGDIVSVCNQIYQRLGDLQAAQEEANALFSQVISLLNTTNGKLDAINMAMSTYFELLINQLKQEGLDTRTAIADAEARLEAYLKPMIDYFNELEEQTGESASTLPKHKTDIDGFDNQGYGIDADGQAGVAALVPILSAFGWIWSVIALFIGVGVIHILVKKGIG